MAPFFAYAFSKYYLGWEFPNSFFLTVGFTTVTWLVVTFVTKPEPMEHLLKFYTKVLPEGSWGPVTKVSGIERKPSRIFNLVVCWLSAVTMTYSLLFFTGKFIFHEWKEALIFAGVGLVSFATLKVFMNKTKILD